MPARITAAEIVRPRDLEPFEYRKESQVFTVDEVREELSFIAQLLGPMPERFPEIGAEEWSRWVREAHREIMITLEEDERRSFRPLGEMAPAKRAAFRWRVSQLMRALWHGAGAEAGDMGKTQLLVLPSDAATRFVQLVGDARLTFGWLVRFDVLDF